MNLKSGYTAIGIVLIFIGTGMPLYFYSEATIVVIFPVSTESPSSACTVVTATSTEANGTTHRHYNVTCSETVHISSIPKNATLAAPIQSLLSNVTAAISVVSTIATVAVALTILPLQGEERAKLKSGIACSLVATSLVSMAVAIGLFLILALPLNTISTWLSLRLLLIMLASTLVGYGFSIISWGMYKENPIPAIIDPLSEGQSKEEKQNEPRSHKKKDTRKHGTDDIMHEKNKYGASHYVPITTHPRRKNKRKIFYRANSKEPYIFTRLMGAPHY